MHLSVWENLSEYKGLRVAFPLKQNLSEYPLYIFSVWRFRDLCYLANFPTFEDDSIDMVSSTVDSEILARILFS